MPAMNTKIFGAVVGFASLLAVQCAHDSQAGGRSLGAQMAKIAREELSKWKGLVETSPKATSKLQNYWGAVGKKHSAAQLQDARFHEDNPWSAAFISWVVKTSGDGKHFYYSAAHWRYIAAAKQNRLMNINNPFKAYRTSEVKPQVGDIVCKWRNAKDKATYDNIDTAHQAHGDIVIEVTPTKLVTVGGNVSNSVSVTNVSLDDKGYISDARYFAVVTVGR